MSMQLTEQEKAEGWREFNGGECPVNKNDKVQVRLRCGNISSDFARAYTWNYTITPALITPALQIIAYRLIEQENSKNNGGDTDYYAIPDGAKTLNDLIEFKDMAFWRGEIMKAIYGLEGRMQKNKDEANAERRELNKIIYYAQRRLAMLDHGKSE